jgi:peptide chain release factor subunit 1
MGMKNEMKRLAQMTETSSPFISLYLDTKWDDEKQRERIRLFTKNQMRKNLEHVKHLENWQFSFSEDQKRIEKFVEGLVRRTSPEEINGVALFACHGAGTFFTYPSFIPFENQCFLSERPVLSPLVKLSTQYQNTLAVKVDTDSAQLFEISFEGISAESTIESFVPGRHDQGGWAQMRYQRHIQDHIDKHHKEVADQLTTLFDSGKWKQVVLMGQDRILANFKTFLPERVRLQITDMFPVDFSEERSKMTRRLFERLLQRERESLSRQIRGLRERAPQVGRASFGLDGTLEAIHQGQVHTLYLQTTASWSGTECRKCHALFKPPPGGDRLSPCPLCKGKRMEIPLAEEMIRRTLRQDGEVKWVEEDPILNGNDGVAASLRFH